jgi:DNA-nicking Smr family endonuclease
LRDARAVSLVDRLLARFLRLGARTGMATIPVLDLHGLGVQDAIAATQAFLRDATADGVREVRIVYGTGHRSPEGHGVLREVIPRWLASNASAWVESARPEPDASGADGAMRVRLKAPRSAP